MNYIDCNVTDCIYCLHGECECLHITIDKFSRCESYKAIGKGLRKNG